MYVTYFIVFVFLFSFFNSSDTTTSLPETTKPTHVEIVTRNYRTTASTDEKTNQTITYKDYVIYDEIFMLPILAGVLVLILIITFCMLCIIYRAGKKYIHLKSAYLIECGRKKYV